MQPKVQFYEPAEVYSMNEWRLLAGHECSEAPMKFRSKVLFYDARLEKENSLQTPYLNGRTGFLYLFSGNITIENNGEAVEKGDSVVIKKEEQLDLKSDEDSDLVFFILDESATYSRNGLFAK